MKILLAPAVLALHLSAVQIAGAETIKIGAIATEHGMTGKMDSFFAKKAEELSDGELKFQIFWAGAIGTATEIIPLIKDGALEVGSTAPAFYGSEMPVVGITNSLPFVFENATVAMRVQDALSRSDPHYLDEYKRVGVFPIVQHGLAASHLMCSKPVRNLDDLKGLKIRSYGFFLPVAINALGAVPVSMQLSEVYESMQRGVIDCVPVAYSTALDYKLEEVGKYWSDINLGAISGPALYTSYANYKEGGWSAERISVIDEAATLEFPRFCGQLRACGLQSRLGAPFIVDG